MSVSKLVEDFVKGHGRVRRDASYVNPLVGTSYNTVGLGDDLTSYSVIGEHSSCSQDWLRKNPVVEWEDLTDFEKQTLLLEVIATISVEYPILNPERVDLNSHYETLIKKWEMKQCAE